MDKKKFIRKLGISAADERAIKEKVTELEKRTNGEIALAIVKQSDTYSALELTVAACCTFVLGAVFVIFAGPIQTLLSPLDWMPSASRFASTFLVFTAAVFIVSFLLLNVGTIERVFIPKSLRLANTKRRAYFHFFESGLYKTKGRSGILIFMSVLERTVIVFADEGINAKVDQSAWNTVCSDLVQSLKHKKAGTGFITAVEQCGEILANSFPAKAVNPNELPDGLVVLER